MNLLEAKLLAISSLQTVSISKFRALNIREESKAAYLENMDKFKEQTASMEFIVVSPRNGDKPLMAKREGKLRRVEALYDPNLKKVKIDRDLTENYNRSKLARLMIHEAGHMVGYGQDQEALLDEIAVAIMLTSETNPSKVDSEMSLREQILAQKQIIIDELRASAEFFLTKALPKSFNVHKGYMKTTVRYTHHFAWMDEVYNSTRLMIREFNREINKAKPDLDKFQTLLEVFIVFCDVKSDEAGVRAQSFAIDGTHADVGMNGLPKDVVIRQYEDKSKTLDLLGRSVQKRLLSPLASVIDAITAWELSESTRLDNNDSSSWIKVGNYMNLSCTELLVDPTSDPFILYTRDYFGYTREKYIDDCKKIMGPVFSKEYMTWLYEQYLAR